MIKPPKKVIIYQGVTDPKLRFAAVKKTRTYSRQEQREVCPGCQKHMLVKGGRMVTHRVRGLYSSVCTAKFRALTVDEILGDI